MEIKRKLHQPFIALMNDEHKFLKTETHSCMNDRWKEPVWIEDPIEANHYFINDTISYQSGKFVLVTETDKGFDIEENLDSVRIKFFDQSLAHKMEVFLRNLLEEPERYYGKDNLPDKYERIKRRIKHVCIECLESETSLRSEDTQLE